ncbi:hypothetical protein ACJZQ5_002328 [Enterococcus hirae]|uniref:hypothetical protein n=1 Tax=Enterococcus hirae TaxID=1354 RepID=UPI000B9F9C57|nr:hypothetical protein [Enterococcus hirae]EMF0298911.1 hypothetical protein [Enterococcus hirae]EMF0385125.1 hypothetical protein [Enterococcus hirae]OZS39982.1 hypothetical protein CHB54_09025 [Enterococcus hirae]OZS41122.1 hypothetical protein CHB54_00740 [Enterococcus hirae]PCE08186.1 hypothetical protein CKY13_03420 [Enterococcus hirae]
MNNVVYQLTTENICQFLTNREHLNEVTRRVKHSFSCMEELKEFVNSVEQELYKEKHTSALKVEAEINYFTLSPTMENDATLLRFETDHYIMEVFLETNKWVKNYLNCMILRKEYYSENEYVTFVESGMDMEERMEELNQKQYNHFDYYLLFAQFLTDETELALVFGNGYMLTVPQSFLDEYKKEIANSKGNNSEMRKELYETFHLDETEQMLVELERKKVAYQMFILKNNK